MPVSHDHMAAQPCDTCDAPCASVCAPHRASGEPALAPRALLRVAAVAPNHALTTHCSRCGACELVCPHLQPVRARLGQDGSAEAQAFAAARWREEPARQAPAVVWASCAAHGVHLPAAPLAAALERRGSYVVSDGLSCGGEGSAPALSRLIATRLVGVREIVVPTGACQAALRGHLQAAGLRGRRVAVLDQWLARFGVTVAAHSLHFGCCRLNRDGGGRGDAHSAAIFPAQPTCCGAGEPLASSAPEIAEATAWALLERWRAAGTMAVHVEDLACAQHLRAVAVRRGAQVAIHSRLDTLLNTHPEAPPDSTPTRRA